MALVDSTNAGRRPGMRFAGAKVGMWWIVEINIPGTEYLFVF